MVYGKQAGTFGISGAFSLHPLKNLNVWGDGGVITTSDEDFNIKLRRLRNHGLADRDNVVMLGCNSRLDSLQAVVGNWPRRLGGLAYAMWHTLRRTRQAYVLLLRTDGLWSRLRTRLAMKLLMARIAAACLPRLDTRRIQLMPAALV